MDVLELPHINLHILIQTKDFKGLPLCNEDKTLRF